MEFEIKEFEKIKLKDPILIEGLPGIGNVGKIAIDFMIDSVGAKKMMEIYSSHFPHSVFVNEENLVDLPKIEVYYKKGKKRDFLFVSGDIQPLDETSCHAFCETILNIFQKQGGKEIITLGGIGLPKIPKQPLVYCTANEKAIIKKYKSKSINTNIFGVVGPIIGVSGLLIGLASKRKIPGMILLAQTFGHPTYIGIRGARELLKVLKNSFELNLDIESLDKEIESIEKEVDISSKTLSKLTKAMSAQQDRVSYIG
ncbi:PAC2 family protein [Candidatus Woesearchaeota archaeon]|nr:PAC2 family protein [Candidatus Woesearchaeota archaeon]